jgi:hypothetical protein
MMGALRDNPMIDMFISHSSQDDAIVDQIYDRLVKAGMQPFADHRDIQQGQDWAASIDNALHESIYGMVILSHASVQSIEVRGEYLHFLQQNKPLYPVVVSPKVEIPYPIAHYQYFDLVNNFDAGVEYLIKIIKHDKQHPGMRAAEAVVPLATKPESRVTLRLNLRDMEAEHLKSLITGLTEAGIHEIEVVDVGEG